MLGDLQTTSFEIINSEDKESHVSWKVGPYAKTFLRIEVYQKVYCSQSANLKPPSVASFKYIPLTVENGKGLLCLVPVAL